MQMIWGGCKGRASYQPAFMDSCLLVTHIGFCTCPVYLVDELVVGVRCSGVFYGWCTVSSVGSWCYSREWVSNPRTKLCCNVSGLMSSKSKFQLSDRRIVSRERKTTEDAILLEGSYSVI